MAGDATTMFGVGKIVKVLDVFVDNIYVKFSRNIYKKCWNPIDNCAPLIADVFLFSYERAFMLIVRSDTRSSHIKNSALTWLHFKPI